MEYSRNITKKLNQNQNFGTFGIFEYSMKYFWNITKNHNPREHKVSPGFLLIASSKKNVGVFIKSFKFAACS